MYSIASLTEPLSIRRVWSAYPKSRQWSPRMLMTRGIPPEYCVIRSIAASVKMPRSRAPAMRSRLRMYCRASSTVSGGI